MRSKPCPAQRHVVTQKAQAVASMVTVLNALSRSHKPGIGALPHLQPGQRHRRAIETILPRAILLRQGMTLDELGRLLTLYPVEAKVHHAADSSLDASRGAASEHLSEEGKAVIVNYLREGLGQQRARRSPACDPTTDRFLILDVARYKCPPVRVSARKLFDAMNMPDGGNQNRTRGYVL